jgi:hypothetical protein
MQVLVVQEKIMAVAALVQKMIQQPVQPMEDKGP